MKSWIEIEDPQQPEVLAMLADSDSCYAKLYLAESNHCLTPQTSHYPR